MNVKSVLLLLSIVATAAVTSATSINNTPHIAMVEFKAGKGCNAKKVVSDHLNAKGIPFEIRTDINSKLFCGASFSVAHDVDAAAALDGLAGVVGVFNIQQREPPKPIKDITPKPTPKGSEEPIHTITGVNDARNKLGLTGKGIKVAVIDTGVYYLHPALGGGFGRGYKVSAGYDMVGDNYVGGNTPVPDNDPIDNCSEESHGTHVAGIIAGDSRNITTAGFTPAYPYTGAAPDANIIAIRVFGCSGFVDTDVIAAAIYKAVELKADIINLSLGGGPAYADEIDAIAASRAGKAGHIVLSANGNDGNAGLFVNGDPGDSSGGFGVASFDNVATLQYAANIDSKEYPFSVGSNNGSFAYPADFTSSLFINDPTGTATGDGCSSVSSGASGKAALLHWDSSCGSNRRCTNAFRAGATACLIYSNTNTIIDILGSPLLPCASLAQEAGAAILAAVNGGKTPTVVLTNTLKNFPMLTAGTVSDFSSGGFDMELHIKPDIGGIGANVYSTISPHAAAAAGLGNAYGVLSGTSMATPYTAGCVALLLQSKGLMQYDYAAAILQNTAVPKKIFNTDQIDSVARQGAGLVNIYNAVTAKTFVYPSSLSLNDTVRTKECYYLFLVNGYRKDVEYTFKNLPAATANPFVPGDDIIQPAIFTAYTNESATVYFGYGKETVFTTAIRRGASKHVSVSFEAPKMNGTLFPIYSGYIQITNNVDDSVITVPYAGMVGDWSKSAIWSRKSAIYKISTGVYTSNQLDTPLNDGAVVNLTANPLAIFAPLATTTRFAQIDITYVGKDAKVLAALKSRGLTNTASGFSNGVLVFAASPGGDLSVYVSGLGQRNTPAVVQSVLPPSIGYFTGAVIGNFSSDLTQLPAGGPYQINFRGLKHFHKFNEKGKKGNDAFDVITSAKFSIVY